MLEWKNVAKEKPPYETKVLIWIECDLCRKKEEHCHKLLASPANYFMEPQIGIYHEPDIEAKEWYEYKKMPLQDWMINDHWSPCTPTHWALIPNEPTGNE